MEEKSIRVTKEDLTKLPRKAIIAFAARCALRVFSVFTLYDKLKNDKSFANYISDAENSIHTAIIASLGGTKPKWVRNATFASATAAAEFDISAAAVSAAVAALDALDETVVSLTDSIAAEKAASVALASGNVTGLTSNSAVIAFDAAKEDYYYLLNWKEISIKFIKDFYARDLWLGYKLKNWDEIENKFKNVLKDLNLYEIYERYKSGGVAYIDLSFDEKDIGVLNEEVIQNLKFDNFNQTERFEETEDVETQMEEEVEEKETPSKINVPPKPPISIVSGETKPVLNVEKHASVVAEILENFRYERGQFVGIFGQWGRGKTYFWEQLKLIIDKEENFETETFHAWKYQDTPASWAYLYEILANKYFSKPQKLFKKGWGKFWFRRVRLGIKRGQWKKPTLSLVSSIIISILAFSLFDKNINWQNKYIWLYPIIPIITFLVEKYRKDFSTKAIDIFQNISKKVSFEKHLGAQAEIQKELVKLLQVWFRVEKGEKFAKKRLLLFVDDIDRCDE